MTALRLYGRRTAVYRLYAKDGTLLYVGCSCDPSPRVLHGHLYKPWGRDIATVDGEWFDDRYTALQEEARAIVEESPLHNKRRTPPDRIRKPQPAPAPPTDGLRFTFLEAAQLVGVPVHWLWRDVARNQLPHTCSNPMGNEVWFTADDIRDIDTIFDYAPELDRRRQVQSDRQRIRRLARLKRCSHAA